MREKKNFYIPLPRELRNYPAARTLRTTFLEKLKDTFYALAGKPLQKTGKFITKGDRLGILDYLTLGIPRVFTKAFLSIGDYLSRFQTPIPKALSYVPLGLGKILQFARNLIALVATVLVSPLVLVIHGVSKAVGYSKYGRAREITNEYGQTLDIYLGQNRISPDELRLTKIDARTDNNSARTITLEFSKKQKGDARNQPLSSSSSSSSSSGSSSGSSSSSFLQPFVVRLTQLKNGDQYGELPQKQTLHALMNLNMFKAHSRVMEGSSTKFTICKGALKEASEDGLQLRNKVSDEILQAIIPGQAIT